MRQYLILILLLVSSQLFAQDIIATKAGDLKISPILHGSLILEYDEEVIYVDPYGGAEMYANQKQPTLILITDIHGDHHNPATLQSLDLTNASFIVPSAVAKKMPDTYQATVLNNGEQTIINGVSIAAIPMYNLPETEDSRHPKGRGNGYVLEFADQKVYISGDTEDIPEMRRLKDVDVAFVCMNLPYTMDVDQAADAVAEFKPRIVYPFHFRGKGGLSDVDRFKSLVEEAAPSVDVRLRNWYPE